MPLVVALECRLASHLNMPMARVRRAPLPLVLLWLNYAVQSDGMETWWLAETAAHKGADMVQRELAALRAEADDISTWWDN